MTTVDSSATQSCGYLMVRSRIVCSQKDLTVNHFLHAGVLLTLAMAHHRVKSDLVVAPVTTGHFILPFAEVVLCKVKSADSNIWWKSCHSLSWLYCRLATTMCLASVYLFTYLLTYAHRSQWSIGHDPPPSHSVLGCSCHSRPVGPLLFQLCFSVLPPTVARPASLPLPLRVPGQGLACGAGCWLPEGVSDPAPLPPQYLLGHWFLSRSFPQIFILDLLLPLDFVDGLFVCWLLNVQATF